MFTRFLGTGFEQCSFYHLREKINLDANNKLWNFVTSVHLLLPGSAILN